MVFLLLLYSFTDVTSTVPGQWPKVVHYHTYIHYIRKLTQSFYNSIFLSLEPQGSRLQNCPDYIFSLHQTSVFCLPLSYSVLLPCQSVCLSSKLPSKACEATLSCNTNFPTYVAQWLQLNQTKISTLWQQPKLLI